MIITGQTSYMQLDSNYLIYYIKKTNDQQGFIADLFW